MSFPIRPLLDNIIVRDTPAQDLQGRVTGIISTGRGLEKPLRGEVVAVSEDSPVKVGDVVLYTEYALTDDARIYAKPEDKYNPELPEYYRIRVHDLKGVVSA